jgi:hypothetical protein
MRDKRYTIAKEFCGYATARYVARSCGEWIGQDINKSDATMLCVAHADKRFCPHCNAPNCNRNHMAENAMNENNSK